MHARIHRSITIATSLDEAWSFFSQPRNLAKITPPSLGFRITSPLSITPDEAPGSDKMYPGQIISYTVTPIPFLPFVPLTWITEITHVRAPYYFVDEQRQGPYKMWHHQHHFKEVPGGVQMDDIVDYIMPLGILGAIPHALFVRSEVERIFDYRTEVMKKLFTVISS